MDTTTDTTLDELLSSLKPDTMPLVKRAEVEQEEDASVDEMEEGFDAKKELAATFKALNELIKTNSEVLEEAKRLVDSTGDVEYLEVYSSIGKAQSEAFKNKVKLLMEKEKNKITKDTKNREIVVKEKLADHTISVAGSEIKGLPSGTSLNQTNVIMSGSREEMFDMLSKMQALEEEKKDKVEEKEKEPIDV